MERKSVIAEKETARPLVTFLLFAYNQEKFVREAVEGAFSQTYTPLEIILSDDSSDDRTFEIMKNMVNEYHGPHYIILNRNENNLGICAHINHLVNMSSGGFIILAAGDDVSLPERASILAANWIESGKLPMSIYSDAISIDENSNVIGKISREYGTDIISVISRGDFVLGCAHGFAKKIFDLFGPLNSGVVNEDQVIPFRSLLVGKVVRIPKSLVKYRICRSLWKEKSRTANLKKNLQVPRYKCGVLRISALVQMGKDVKLLNREVCCNPSIAQIEKSLNDKIVENQFFIDFLDKKFITTAGRIIKNFSSFYAGLRAFKRYIKLLIR